ncbi:ankyrin [Annulohypoxylon maeteangense]|uniref:ankyrin n=1 Tax=Annulohypoxylon maeteangense TaxID=1927788 RepID=UPI0020072F5A|nr:ankyrin [Annulohypoxylon maeteangense]KAI0888074.1 ankyrin [Annulohypoxylon maeteangense]
MDVISAISGVSQLVQLAGSLAKGLSRFIIKTKYIHDTIREVHDEISDLRSVVSDIENILEKRPKLLPFERDHHEKIHRIIQSCHTSLKTLADELPDLKDKPYPLERIRLTIEKCLQDERIKDLIQHISSYKAVLQLSLTTISLGAIWETTRSQKQIENEIRKLTDAIRMSPYLSSGRIKKGHPPSIHLHSAGSEAGEDVLEESSLEKEIRDWRMTADDIAVAVSLNDFDGASVDSGSVPPKSLMSVETLPLYEEDTYDPEPEYEDVPNNKILECQLDANQEIVQYLMKCGLFVKAASYQQRGIKLMEQLLGIQTPAESDDQVPARSDLNHVSTENLTDMKEELADIFLQSESDETDLEAKIVLRNLLDEEVKREADQINDDRRARLYHKLGNIFFRQGNTVQARKFLTRALEGRQKMNPVPSKLVEESAEMLVQVLQETQALDEARGLREWIRLELHTNATLPSPPTVSRDNSIDLTCAYQWCKEQGMNVDDESFRFGSYDPAIKTMPIHRATQKENIEILSHMLSNEAHAVEQRDLSGSTLLHVAAGTRNRDSCALLLEHHADPDVVDRNGATPLHRCQAGQGGVRVAEMLLKYCPSLIDRPDGLGKTALYLACEKGNEDMVKMLLSTGKAKPNISGPGKCTPLIVAINFVAQQSRKIHIVELLLLHGADPNIPDVDGRTASTAAKNAGLAGEEIKSLLSFFPPKRRSAATISFPRSSGSERRKSSNSSGHTI